LESSAPRRKADLGTMHGGDGGLAASLALDEPTNGQ